MPETGKQAVTGHILFSGDSDGADIAQRNAKTSGIPGIFPEKAGRGKEQTAGADLHCQTAGKYRVRNVEEPHGIPGTGEKNRGRNCLKSVVGAFIMEKRTAEKGYPCSFSGLHLRTKD